MAHEQMAPFLSDLLKTNLFKYFDYFLSGERIDFIHLNCDLDLLDAHEF